MRNNLFEVRSQYSKLGDDVIGRSKKTKGLKLNGRLDNADRRRLVVGEARVLSASTS